MGQFPSHALEFATLPEEFPEEGFDVGAYDGLELNRGTAEDLELLCEDEATKTTEHIYVIEYLMGICIMVSSTILP